jgi:hypothetical protein
VLFAAPALFDSSRVSDAADVGGEALETVLIHIEYELS